jgi:hypothetical protein
MCGWIVTQVDLTVVLEGFCDPFPSFFHNVDVGAALKCEALIAKNSFQFLLKFLNYPMKIKF